VALAGLAAALVVVFRVMPALPPARVGAVVGGVFSVWIVAALLLPPTFGLALLPGAGALAGAWAAWRGRSGSVRPEGSPMPAPAPTAPTPPGAAPEVAAAAAPRALPTMLGRYRVEAQIGRGSMGAVYLGHDPQIGRQVAIKTLALSREFSGDKLVEARERFFREAATAGRLQHPDIVTIFDAGEAQELAYIAMEFIKGHDLQMHAVPNRLLPLPQVLEITARVAEALAYAHSQGVVHRDIKPANVMVDPDSKLVKVMDFGVARITDASRTRTGLVLGTPSYMSPEQMAGRRLNGRTDLYSLGVMLFQLLTGTLPHTGDSMAKLMYQIANEPAPDVRTLRPELPEALANVVALALEKRPEVRYADGRQMASDLRELAGAVGSLDTPAAAGPPDQFEKTVTFSRDDPRHNSEP
jgi:eukaryotic-like serine/threonine-protein kinase